MHRFRFPQRSLIELLGALATAVVLMQADAAIAQNNPFGNIFGAILQNAIQQSARKSWEKVDPDVRECLARKYNLNTDALSSNGITATDYRVTSYIQNCSQDVAQQRYQQEQEQQRQADQQRAAELAAREQKEAEAAQREADRKAAADAEKQRKTELANADAARKARHQLLVSKYGTFAEAIEAGELRKGMTKAAVVESRGNPQRIERIPPDDELWIYASDRVAISKGKVSYVGH